MQENTMTLQELRTFNCEKCDGSGWVHEPLEEGSDYTVARHCACRPTRVNIARISRCGIEDALDRNRFSQFKTSQTWQRTLKNRAEAYTDEMLLGGDAWFMVCGQVGSGKTHICTAIMRELLYNGVSAKYVMWREIAMDLKRSQFDEEIFNTLFDSLTKTKVLYIDDFLKGNITESDKHFAYDIINGRYVRDLPTIISCEKTYSDIMEIDPAIGSRIYEKTKGYYSVIGADAKKNVRMGI